MKRNLFNELKEGFTALESVREGKITLRQHIVEKNLRQTSHLKSCSICGRSCTYREPYLPGTCVLTNAQWKTGNRAAPVPMLKLQF